MNRKILMSLGAIVFVVALSITATGAFFSDSETSTGNTLTAGAIDLKIDNSSYVTSTTTGLLVASPKTTWTIRDLTVEKFFDFEDVKPGDIGEDTISLHVDDNDSYLCADVTLTSNEDNTVVEPEIEAGDNASSTVGELAGRINFTWWADDGDNVFESDEVALPGGPLGALAVGATTTVTLADSTTNIWTGVGGPVPGASTRYIGKAWCYGTLTPAPVAQDFATTSSPLVRGTGFTCNGAAEGNIGQTDSLTADISFRAVQSRNNASFQCVPDDEVPPLTTLTLAKAVIPPAAALDTAFTLTASSTNTMVLISGVEGNPSITNTLVSPGVYVLSETGGPEGALSRVIECSGNATAEVDNGNGTGTVTVAAGENVVCGFTNTFPEILTALPGNQG
jgi:predicted ribosomally synthesized peptide with SipW-like signal peptide